MGTYTNLKDSLLYRMSLGSKELYHSNVWAWLIEKEPKFIECFFDDSILKNYIFLGIEREFKHRDIIIWLQKKGFYGGKQEKYYLVIENKIKSLPTKEQLQDYTEDICHNKLLSAVFTGMVNPFGGDVHIKNSDCEVTWKYVDYNIIADKILSIMSQSDNDIIKNKNEQILEYCGIIQSINSLINIEIEKNKNRLVYDCADEIEELNILDLYTKIKGNDFMEYVKKREDEIPQISGFNLDIHQSYNNAHVTLDFRYASSGVNRLVIGVQIEGSQYRILAERDAKEMTCQEVYDAFKFNWFNVKPKSKSMRNDYCKYSTEDYSFVYQYNDIDDTNNIYEILFENIKNDLNRAKEIIARIKQ